MAIQDTSRARDIDLALPVAVRSPTHPQGRVGRSFSAARNLWRQLTSMRTALVLLFLLALASLPGALLPQWSLNRSKTAQYLIDHPTVGPWLDRLGFFQVFAAPWYAAIYLLLFTSLVGCVLPRCREFLTQLRMPPVATPRNLSRMPHHDTLVSTGEPAAVADRIQAGLRGWRVARRVETTGTLNISAEKGYLREVGNLVFHMSLLGLLVAIAVGKLIGYEGSVLVDAGAGFCSAAPISFDDFRPGLLIDGTELTPFCVNVQNFTASYSDAGQATGFRADINYQSGADLGTGTWTPAVLQVNDPLRLDGERLYLTGHGFTPHFRLTYPDGSIRDYAQPFQPMDSAFTSQGAVKITDPPTAGEGEIRRRQLAIVGIFAPTAVVRGGVMSSSFPAANAPGVAVEIYRGDLGMESGRPQSVFAIDTTQVDKGALVKQKRANLTVGQSLSLDDGTTVTFTGYNEFVALQTSYDPAQLWVLLFAALLLAGLMTSLTIKRRRVWYRLAPAPGGAGHTTVQVGGLARTDQAGYGEEFTFLAALPHAHIGGQDNPGKERRWKRRRTSHSSGTSEGGQRWL